MRITVQILLQLQEGHVVKLDCFAKADLVMPICDKDNGGIISVGSEGGETPYSYFWHHDNELNSASSN